MDIEIRPDANGATNCDCELRRNTAKYAPPPVALHCQPHAWVRKFVSMTSRSKNSRDRTANCIQRQFALFISLQSRTRLQCSAHPLSRVRSNGKGSEEGGCTEGEAPNAKCDLQVSQIKGLCSEASVFPAGSLRLFFSIDPTDRQYRQNRSSSHLVLKIFTGTSSQLIKYNFLPL